MDVYDSNRSVALLRLSDSVSSESGPTKALEW